MGLECKVARILNERDLVVNKGADDGVKVEMKFRINEPEVSINDPDTGVPLGTLTREKIRVRIVEVRPKFSIGKTYQTYRNELRPYGNPFTMITKVRTLRTDDAVTLGPLDPDSALVKVGDPAVEVEEETGS